ncbi:class I SAM-dependent methyltransferase [Cetobacterium sp. 8H]|uniref:methyltransferase domain-containing protein n=1 Tax=Cetobacterium sp. 8H TaxID=2759681 RepID=UPI00163C63BC|nr:class I SAM-dependent methyltransferase [Cetobacterium sp. 8H]
MKENWDEIYKELKREELGWYEKESCKSIDLIQKYTKDKEKIILDAGCGETTLIQSLIEKGYQEIIGIDFSIEAINFLKKTIILGEKTKLHLEVKDLTDRIEFLKKGSIWHDRAVFHFLQTSKDREAYKNNLKNFLEKDGIFIISCFSKKNDAEKCNDLLVKKYDLKELIEIFGDSFKFKESLEYDYKMPWGDIRKYITCVFSKV